MAADGGVSGDVPVAPSASNRQQGGFDPQSPDEPMARLFAEIRVQAQLERFRTIAGTKLQSLRHGPLRDDYGELVAFDTAYVQWELSGSRTGSDGLGLMKVEIGPPPPRLSTEQKALIDEFQWSPPESPDEPNWWCLIGSESEGLRVGRQILALLMTVFDVPRDEISNSIEQMQPATDPRESTERRAEADRVEKPNPLAETKEDQSTQGLQSPMWQRSYLAALVGRWNALADKRGLPPCDQEMEYRQSGFACNFSEDLVPGTNAYPCLQSLNDSLWLTFNINNEGNPPVQAMRQALERVVPNHMVLEINGDDALALLYLHVDVTDIHDDDGLAQAWSVGSRVATVLWAATFPWDDYRVPDVRALGFSENDLGEGGHEHPLARLIYCAAVYMTRFAEEADPEGGHVSRKFLAGEAATHLDLARAYATGYGTDELVDVYGRWIGWETSPGHPMCCVYEPSFVAQELNWGYESDRAAWQLPAYKLDEGQTARLGQLGWQQGPGGDFEIRPAYNPVDEGRIVARTVVDVLGADLREDIPRVFDVGNWEDARQELLDYIKSDLHDTPQ